MTQFHLFAESIKKNFQKMSSENSFLFKTDTPKDELWETYLKSFPPGFNNLYRERTEHDCSVCRQFIKNAGNIVTINENFKLISIWDDLLNHRLPGEYEIVADELSKLVKSAPISEVFLTQEKKIGTEFNFEELDDGSVIKYHHFCIHIPDNFQMNNLNYEKGQYRDNKNVLERSLELITPDAVETVLDLINQKSLYKGEEWEGVLRKFQNLQKEFNKLNSVSKKQNFCWSHIGSGGTLTRIRNKSIGVLLTDISEGMELEPAVQRYEKEIVPPHNYKRPKLFKYSKKQIEDAEKQIEKMGAKRSLPRRHASIDDITVNNIIFANKDSAKRMSGDVFSEMKEDLAVNPKKFSRIDEVTIEDFVNNIIPNVKNIEVLFENNHKPNLVSVIGPKNTDAPTLFKWNNPFCLAYTGNMADSSMKNLVKQAGGNTDGIFRFSIQWNDNQDNNNDFDAHCVEPSGGAHIYYPNKRVVHPSSGMLDVDVIQPKQELPNRPAVENIIYTDGNKMPKGNYRLYVNVYSYRGGDSGFSAEIEFGGQIYSFNYNKPVRQDERIEIAQVHFDGEEFKISKTLDSTVSTKEYWGINTNQFHPVSVVMYSPNYWDEQQGIGHKHYLFIINGCQNDENPNGFFNEFLKEELMKQKRVFEILGNKMKVEYSDDQLSGLGFSSTKRNSIICKLEGSFNRTVKVLF